MPIAGSSSSSDSPRASLNAILVLLGLSAISVLPINWLGAALLLLALSLFVLEAKFTSHGILGAGGAVAMVLGAVLVFGVLAITMILTRRLDWYAVGEQLGSVRARPTQAPPAAVS